MSGHLITTTVSVDTSRNDYAQVTINLVQGDAGTRRIQFVPAQGGAPIDMSEVAQAKVAAASAGGEALQIDCTIEYGKIYMVPTAALVQYENVWQCQLVLFDSSNNTLRSLKFTINVQTAVYTDAVEHTNTNITSISWNSPTKTFALHKADDTTLYSPELTHSHANATPSAAGFMSAGDKDSLDRLNTKVDQAVKTTDSPTFANLTIGDVSINGTTGVVTGLRFT